MRQTKIFNGNIHPRKGGHRCVVTNDAGLPIPVLHGVYSGPIGRHCSVQVKPAPSDLIFTVIWGDNPHTPEFQVSRYDDTGHPVRVHGNDYVKQFELARAQNQWLDNWLSPLNSGASFLPCFGESEYRVHKDKLNRIATFISRFHLPMDDPHNPSVQQEWLRTPKTALNLRPRLIDFDPSEYIPGQYHETANGKCIHRKQHFFTIHGRANACQPVDMAWLDMVLECGQFESTHSDGNPLEQGLPAKWDLLIRVIEQAHANTRGQGYGYKVDIWSPKR